MNNLLSYCGLVDARISASEKDLSVKIGTHFIVRGHPWILILILLSQFLLNCLRVLEELDCIQTDYLCYEFLGGKYCYC
jgi:hypothetical protein